jgi:Integrase core domain
MDEKDEWLGNIFPHSAIWVQLTLRANAHVESFHGRLREECLRVSWFQNLFDARRKIAFWRLDYNEQRPHSSLNYRTPAEFAREMSYGKDVGFAHFENADGVSNFPTASAAAG